MGTIWILCLFLLMMAAEERPCCYLKQKILSLCSIHCGTSHCLICFKHLTWVWEHQESSEDFVTVQFMLNILSTLSTHTVGFWGLEVRWDKTKGRLGCSHRVRQAGIHKAALGDYTVSGTTVGPIWTYLNIRYTRWMLSVLHEPASVHKVSGDLNKRANGTNKSHWEGTKVVRLEPLDHKTLLILN